mgnify:CR=1 FL=1
MSKKTIGDYMRMMKSAEKEEENTKDNIEESKCDCTGDGKCQCPSDCSCGCNAVSESISVSGVEPMMQESETFLKYTKDMLSKFSDIIMDDINKHIDTDESYVLNEYLILGVTLEQGLIVVLKCTNEFDEEKNVHIEISTEGVITKGEV